MPSPAQRMFPLLTAAEMAEMAAYADPYTRLALKYRPDLVEAATELEPTCMWVERIARRMVAGHSATQQELEALATLFSVFRPGTDQEADLA